jgi:hypothetical protein
MPEAVGYGCGGGAKIKQGHDPLQTMMTGLMEEVAEADHTRGFAGKIHRQSSRAATENSSHRVQFSAAVLQVGASHGEIGNAGRRHGREKDSILRVPELVPAGRFWQSLRPDRSYGWREFDRLGIEHCPVVLGKGRLHQGLLSKGDGAKRGRDDQRLGCWLERGVKPGCLHDFSSGPASARSTSTTGFAGRSEWPVSAS